MKRFFLDFKLTLNINRKNCSMSISVGRGAGIIHVRKLKVSNKRIHICSVKVKITRQFFQKLSSLHFVLMIRVYSVCTQTIELVTYFCTNVRVCQKLKL